LRKLLAQFRARRGFFRRGFFRVFLAGETEHGGDLALGQQCRQQAIFRTLLGLRAHALLGLFAIHLHRGVGEVAHDLFDILADVPHFGEARGFHFHEGSVGERGQAPCDFRLADAGGADHQDVLRHHLVAQFGIELHAAPAVAQGDGDRALGGLLPDDVAVEFLHDLARRHGGGRMHGEFVHQSSSTTMLRFV
jgi:hypothetical protein